MSKLIQALLILIIFSLSSVSYVPPHENPGPASDKVVFKAIAQEIASMSIERGDIDLYFYTLRPLAARELMAKGNITVLKAPASMVSILLNPAPAPRGELNPLSIREVRRALQYALNRDYIVNEIYKGLAVPMVCHVSPLEYDYLTVFEVIQRFNYRYDPEYARKLIFEALTERGAELRGGKWYYNGKPIKLKFIIRVEDERREIGDLFASELERLGFFVERIYQFFGPAILRVYGTDPRAFEWHLYTEGWDKGSIEKHDYATIGFMNAPWLGNMPGWLEAGYWQYENKELDELTKRIFMGNYSSIEERNELYRKATKIALNESVRLWIATVINCFPVNPRVRGITVDLASGPKIWTLRDAYIPGRREIKVGHLWVWTERTIWNPVGGFIDVYSVDVWRNVHDPPLTRHPFKGEPMPFRATYAVETAGPNGKLSVPPDAFIWSSAERKWRSVGEGVKAISKVTFNFAKYIGSKWHHGVKISMADLLYYIYQSFDLVYNPNKSQIEYALATVSKPFLETFKGFRIINETSIEVYVDFWHFNEDYIAEYALPAGFSMPWEILLASDVLVFDKRMAAYTDTAALRFSVDWLSLVEENHARLVKMVLSELLEKEYFPENVFRVGGKSFSSKEDALNRYEASIRWFEEHGLMIISCGPFVLSRFDPAAQYAELTAFRDPSYPFKPGDWFFGKPKIIEIVEVKAENLTLGVESMVKVKVSGPEEVELKYILVDPSTGEEVFRGEAARRDDFLIISIPREVTSELEPGAYRLTMLAYSEDVSQISERTLILEFSAKELAPAEVSLTETPIETIKPKTPEYAEYLTIIAIVIVVLLLALTLALSRRRK